MASHIDKAASSHSTLLITTALLALAMPACSDGASKVVCVDSGAADSADEPRGLVFVDHDGDGVFSAGDEPAAGAVVFFEDSLCTRADSAGRYSLPAPSEPGIVWVRSQDGWRPGPHWAKVAAAQPIAVDFAIPPQTATGPFSFVVGSDTHAGIDLMSVEDQILGLTQATALAEKPYFITVTGDLTQANRPGDFDSLGAAIAAIDVPFVPVPGNHDWYDGGAAYRDYFGPPTYSFDAGGFHFVVLNDASSLEARLAFLDADLELIGDDRSVVVMMHAPPRTDLRLELEARGIDTLLTGHMHTNRVLFHDSFIEYNTQPLVMGGMDLTPGGYRIFRDDGNGGLSVSHRNTVNQPIAVVASPAAGQIIAPCEARILASVQSSAATTSVTATVEGVGDVPLTARGGWVYASDELDLCTAGTHAVQVHVTFADATTIDVPATLELGPVPAAATPTNWSMFHGNAVHSGRADWSGAYPERTQWSNEVGGTVNGGSPIVHDGRVYVSVSDFGDALAGGIVAYDAVTGQRLWEHRVGFSVPHAPAAAGDKILFLSNDGTLHCVDAATGGELWAYELAPAWPPVQRNLYSSPTVVGNTVFAGGRHEFAALDIDSGQVLWSIEPFTEFGDLSSHASPAVSSDVVVIPFNRKGGLYAYDAQLGTELWHTPWEITLGIQGSPVIEGDRVYVVNELMQVTALDLLTGEVQWQRTVEPDAFAWGYLSSATPTVGDGQLFIASQRGALIAMDINTGAQQWTYHGEDSLIRTTHYHGRTPAFVAAPTSTPGRVWIPSADGTIRVVDSSTGQELWSLDLGLPMTSSMVLAGELAYVATFDGTIRALSGTPLL